MKTKEVQFRPNIADHDFDTKLRHIDSFLEKKMNVKVVLKFKGREVSRPNNEIINRLITLTKPHHKRTTTELQKKQTILWIYP